jgi:hypothetical protein
MIDEAGDHHTWAGGDGSSTGTKTLDVGIYTMDTYFYSCWCTGFRCAYDL